MKARLLKTWIAGYGYHYVQLGADGPKGAVHRFVCMAFHGMPQVAQIAASIREFGWTNPVLVDGENGIIAGHGRVLAFREAGLDYYNEAILVTMVGSLPIRAGKQFSTSRKLGKTHQNVLVFCKGDPRKAVEACGDVEIGDDLFPEAGDQG